MGLPKSSVGDVVSPVQTACSNPGPDRNPSRPSPVDPLPSSRVPSKLVQVHLPELRVSTRLELNPHRLSPLGQNRTRFDMLENRCLHPLLHRSAFSPPLIRFYHIHLFRPVHIPLYPLRSTQTYTSNPHHSSSHPFHPLPLVHLPLPSNHVWRPSSLHFAPSPHFPRRSPIFSYRSTTSSARRTRSWRREELGRR